MNIILLFYGLFLISCGIVSVIFIGKTAKTALLSGGSTGIMSLIIGFNYSIHNLPIVILSIFIPLFLFFIFSWRSSKTLFKLIELISTNSAEAKPKAIAFLIISLMAIVSIFTFAIQITEYVQIALLQ
jgi:hypothetical protein